MRLLHSTRRRAALPAISLAMIGGTGCITMSVTNRLECERRQRADEDAWVKANAEIERQAAARLAVELKRAVAESEQEYPAPARKEWK
jgi:hypothetical protein